MREGKLGVTPLEPSQIQPASIDLTLGDTLLFPIPNDYWMVPKGKIPFVNFEKPIEYEKVVRELSDILVDKNELN
jgi:deoxycytidine triphosphate deaminase